MTRSWVGRRGFLGLVVSLHLGAFAPAEESGARMAERDALDVDYVMVYALE